jgi:predicted ATPase/DNA-binding CsgD family transcriptional regulator
VGSEPPPTQSVPLRLRPLAPLPDCVEHAAPPIHGQPPGPLTSLIGRETDVAAVLACLEDGGRLVTLTGPGGVGKTRLALRVAEEAAAGFADGVAFVSLAMLDDPALVLPTIARDLGLRETGMQPAFEVVAAVLRDKHLLLVLDNVEQVRAAATELPALLARCPRLVVLATSRVSLRMAIERRIPVAPLALPPEPRDGDDRAARAALAAAASPAVQLFIARAQAVDPGFTLGAGNAGAIVAICRRLDGLPLAIELAAARTLLLSPAELLARLDPALPLLTSGPEDAPARLRTMRDAVAWSYTLLAPDEQTLFRRLSVFVGGFTLEAAEVVGGRRSEVGGTVERLTSDFRPPTSDSALDLLVSLVDKSLLGRSEHEGTTRFRMLETIREFGLQQLAASDDAAEVYARHSAWCVNLAEKIRRSGGISQKRGLATLESELPNLRAALSWLLARDKTATALHLAAQLAEFWMRHGHLSEGRSWLEQTLAADGAPPTAARAEALVGLNMLLWSSGDFDRCSALLADAESVARTVQNPGALAYARLHQGYVAVMSGEHDLAIARGEEALVTSLAIPQEFSRHGALWLLARSAMEQRDDDRATEVYERLLASARAGGDEISLINALYGLAALAARRAAFDQALSGFAEAAGVGAAIGDRFHASFCLNRAAVCAVALGRPETAARVFAAADRLRTDLGATAMAYTEEYASHEQALAAARAALGDDRFAAVWAHGSALTLEQAIAEVAAVAHAGVSSTPDPRPEADGLTPREREVLRLLAAGWADKEIAAALAIGRRTVSNHVSVILAKLRVTSRTAAAVVAVRDGLV